LKKNFSKIMQNYGLTLLQPVKFMALMARLHYIPLIVMVMVLLLVPMVIKLGFSSAYAVVVTVIMA